MDAWGLYLMFQNGRRKKSLTCLICLFTLLVCSACTPKNVNQYTALAEEYTKVGIKFGPKRLLIGGSIIQEETTKTSSDFMLDDIKSTTTDYKNVDLTIDLGDLATLRDLNATSLHAEFNQIKFFYKGRGLVDLRNEPADSINEKVAQHSLLGNKRYEDLHEMLRLYGRLLGPYGDFIYTSARYSSIESLTDALYHVLRQNFININEPRFTSLRGRTFPPSSQVSTSFKLQQILNFYRLLFSELENYSDLIVDVSDIAKPYPSNGRWYFLKIQAKTTNLLSGDK